MSILTRRLVSPTAKVEDSLRIVQNHCRAKLHNFIDQFGRSPERIMQELSSDQIDAVSGAVTQGQVLNYGAATTAVGAAVLFAVGSPLLVAGASAFAIASAGMWLAGAALDMGWKPKRERSESGNAKG